MKTKISYLIVAAYISLAAGCATEPQSQSNAAPRVSVAQKLSDLRIGMDKNEVVASIGRPDRFRTEESANGRSDVWLYARDTLIARIEGAGASFMSGMRQGINSTGPQAPLELRFVDDKITTIVNR